MTRRGLLIFDLDGTLFRTETVTIPAVQRSFRDRSISVPSDREIKSFFGKPTREFTRWIQSLAPEKDALELAAEVSRRELELISETGELYPRVREVLAELSGLVSQMAICSNGTEDYVPRVLSVHGIDRFFQVVRYRGDSGLDKPALVGDLLKLLDGRPAVVIGDRHDDIEAAHRNELSAIAAIYGYGSEEEWRPADARATQPTDLIELVPGILGKALKGSC